MEAFIAQQADQLTGPALAPWAGAGLLGAVLAWLLFVHLPAKDKQLREKDEAHQGLIDRLATAARTERLADRQEFLAALASLEAKATESMARQEAHMSSTLSRIEAVWQAHTDLIVRQLAEHHVREREQATEFADAKRHRQKGQQP